MSDIAFAAGFSSIRQFNDTFRAMYSISPRQLRRAGAEHAVAEEVVLRLAYRPPFDFAHLIEYFARGRAVDHVLPENLYWIVRWQIPHSIEVAKELGARVGNAHIAISFQFGHCRIKIVGKDLVIIIEEEQVVGVQKASSEVPRSSKAAVGNRMHLHRVRRFYSPEMLEGRASGAAIVHHHDVTRHQRLTKDRVQSRIQVFMAVMDRDDDPDQSRIDPLFSHRNSFTFETSAWSAPRNRSSPKRSSTFALILCSSNSSLRPRVIASAI